MSADRAFQNRSQLRRPTEECTPHRQQRLTSHSATEMPDRGRHGKYMKPSLVQRVCDEQIWTIRPFPARSASWLLQSWGDSQSYCSLKWMTKYKILSKFCVLNFYVKHTEVRYYSHLTKGTYDYIVIYDIALFMWMHQCVSSILLL